MFIGSHGDDSTSRLPQVPEMFIELVGATKLNYGALTIE